MEYFQKLLGETEGEERRVAYAEGVVDENEAMRLVTLRELDRKVALASFGDATRWQRDILGDSAHTLLEAFDVPNLS